MTRTPFQGHRVKGQGHHAALLTTALTHQVAAAVSLGRYWPWEPNATFRSAGSATRGASAPTEGGGGGAYRGGSPLQLVNVGMTWFQLLFLDHV